MPQDQSLPALSLADLVPNPTGLAPALGLGGPDPSTTGALPLPGGPPRLATSPSGRSIAVLNGRQKAAILVRLLLSEGADLKLAALPDDLQTELTEQMCRMRLVDRDTLASVVTEFIETLEQVGLSFTGGIGGAIKALDGKLSPSASIRLRQLAHARGEADPWDRINATDTETLLDLLEPESAEVAAVALSKLPVARAAELLGKMPGERARRVAYAVSLTEEIAPRTVARIGNALAAQLDDKPPRAFDAPPTRRVGAILTNASARLREDLLSGLDAEDTVFAEGVRKAIFTFANIHQRLNPRDVPKVLRDVAQSDLITAFAFAALDPASNEMKSAEFLLANMSQRMAGALRDEVEIRGKVRASDGETAMNTVVVAVRNLIDLGEIEMRAEDDEE